MTRRSCARLERPQGRESGDRDSASMLLQCSPEPSRNPNDTMHCKLVLGSKPTALRMLFVIGFTEYRGGSAVLHRRVWFSRVCTVSCSWMAIVSRENAVRARSVIYIQPLCRTLRRTSALPEMAKWREFLWQREPVLRLYT